MTGLRAKPWVTKRSCAGWIFEAMSRKRLDLTAYSPRLTIFQAPLRISTILKASGPKPI
jgi:hypothetical protein